MKKIHILTALLLFIFSSSYSQSPTRFGAKSLYTSPVYKPIHSPVYQPKSKEIIKPLGTLIFSEDFQGGAIPSTFTLINGDNRTPNSQVSYVNAAWVTIQDFDDPNDIVAVSTSYYDTPAASDDWLISPGISIPSGTTKLNWNARSVDPNFPDGYKVKISKTGNAKSDFTNTLFTIGSENNIWTSRQLDLSAYAGQTIYLAFQNNSYDGFLLLLDDISIFQPDPYDVFLTQTNLYEYPVCPLKQGPSYNNFSALVTNSGSNVVTDPKLSIDINSGLFNTSVMSSNPLNPGDTVRLTSSTSFVPSSIDTFKVDYGVTVNESETYLADNIQNNYFIISDSVLSREEGPADGVLGIGNGGGILGQIFTLNKPDTMTSVSFYLKSPNPGDKITVDVYNFSGQPTNIIASTEELIIPDTMGRWYTLKISGNSVALTSGNFFLGVNETNMNITMGTNSKYFKPNKAYVYFGGNGWNTTEFYNFQIAFLLRANFGKVIPLPLYDVRMMSIVRQEYPIISLRQASAANLKFEAVIKNVGSQTVNNPRLSVDINSGLFTTQTIQTSLSIGQSANFITSTPFNPVSSGIYSVKSIAFISNPESNHLDNYMQDQFEVNDSVMARETGGSTGTLGIGDGTGGTLGQIFTLNTNDTVTSISFYLKNPTMGDQVSADIYNFSSTPTNIIANTVKITIPDTIARWYTLKLNGNYCALAAGTYFVGVNEKSHNIKLGTTTQYFAPNTSWVIFSFNPWETSEYYGFNIAYLLRVNFGKVLPFVTHIGQGQNPSADGLRIGPNPASKYLTIDSRQTIKRIAFMNSLGKILHIENPMSSSINLNIDEYVPGIYFMQVETTEGISYHKLNICR